MATVNLGRVGLVLKGDWDSATSYVKLDVVSHDGNSWAAKRANTNVEPTTENSNDWQLMANNAGLVATVQGYKEDAADSASAAADSATAAAASASKGTEAQAMIAPTEASTTASKAHIPGTPSEYFILGGVLYQATADIAQGGTITPGTNCQAVPNGLSGEVSDLSSEIDDLNDELLATSANPTDVSTADIWAIGSISNQTGSNSSNSSRMRTKGFVPERTSLVEAHSGFLFLVGYQSDGTYVGYWNGNSFEKASTTYTNTRFDITTFNETYPNYRYRFLWGKSNHTPVVATDYAEISVVVDVPDVQKEVVKYKNIADDTKNGLAATNSSILATEETTTNLSTADIWEIGSIYNSNGTNHDVSNRMRTIGYVTNAISFVKAIEGFLYLIAYKANGTYIGMWNGTAFVKQSVGELYAINTDEIRTIIGETYPGFKYRLIWGQSDHTPVVSTDYEKIELIKPDNELTHEIVKYKDTINDLIEAHGNGTTPTGVVGMFEKWAVIGTSYDCGSMYLPNGTAAGNPYMGWAQQLARRYGNTQERLAFGGARTNTWLNVGDNRTPVVPGSARAYNITKLEQVGSTLNMVMIVLGCNDAMHGYNETGIAMGSVSDIVTELPETILSGQTFAYYYSCIICAVQHYAPQAKIILCHSFLKTSMFDADYNGVIDDIAEAFNLPLIEQEKDVYFRGAYHDSAMSYTHPIGANYSGIATAYDRLISDCVYKNTEYFKDYVGGGTEIEPD